LHGQANILVRFAADHADFLSVVNKGDAGEGQQKRRRQPGFGVAGQLKPGPVLVVVGEKCPVLSVGIAIQDFLRLLGQAGHDRPLGGVQEVFSQVEFEGDIHLVANVIDHLLGGGPGFAHRESLRVHRFVELVEAL